jgi:hypothetical protein
MGLLLAHAASVQGQRDTAQVPRALLTALVAHYADRYGEVGDPSIQVGALSPELLAKIGVPPGGRIIGTVNLRRSAVIFGDAPGNAPSLLEWFGNDFRARGYVPRPRPEEAVGFVSPSMGPVTDWCDGSRWLSIRTRNDRLTFASASFEISVDDEPYMCEPRGPQPGRMPEMPEMAERRTLPLLVNPGGAQRSLLCNEWPGDQGMRFDQSAESGYRSALTPAQILAHYARQLDSAGWKRQAPPPAAWGVWTKVDSGVTRHAALLVTPIVGAEGCRHATMKVYRPDK